MMSENKIINDKELALSNYGYCTIKSEKYKLSVEAVTFYVGRFPVTVEEYAAFTRDTAYRAPREPSSFSQDVDHPVVNVSWNDAKAYAQWLKRKTNKGYRLLSEAEWEYCCRARTNTAYAPGDDIDDTKANYGRGVGGTSQVGKHPPNNFGLYDMHGNVWEWVRTSRILITARHRRMAELGRKAVTKVVAWLAVARSAS